MVVRKFACGKCKNCIDDEQHGASVECEICSAWFHVSCVGVHWFCNKCDELKKQLDILEQKVDQIKDKVSRNTEPKFFTLEKTCIEALKRLESNSDVIACAARKTMKNEKRDLKNERDKNLTAFGIAKSNQKK